MNKNVLFVFLLLFSLYSQAQISVSGYVKEMYALYALEKEIPLMNIGKYDMQYNLVHQRLNVDWQMGEHWNFNGAVRTRLMSGKMIEKMPSYSKLTGEDIGSVDMSWNVYDAHSSFINMSVDRFYLTYTLDRLEVSVGRQRINWGIGMVWNPNDVFNHFSYFDFDYEERPGSDAILATYYTSDFSNLDIAVKVDNRNDLTTAMRYRMNIFEYDLQLVGGKLPNDWMLGTGFSGALGAVAIMGELSCIQEEKFSEDMDIVASLEMDYTFSDKSFLEDIQWHTAVLYNSSAKQGPISNPMLFNTSLGQDIRQLSLGNWELFSSIAYPFTPLFSGSIASIVNPIDASFYVSPSVVLSVSDNMELMGITQLCIGDVATEYAALGNIYAGMLRLRYSF